jgi:hypothetical protein
MVLNERYIFVENYIYNEKYVICKDALQGYVKYEVISVVNYLPALNGNNPYFTLECKNDMGIFYITNNNLISTIEYKRYLKLNLLIDND